MPPVFTILLLYFFRLKRIDKSSLRKLNFCQDYRFTLSSSYLFLKMPNSIFTFIHMAEPMTIHTASNMQDALMQAFLRDMSTEFFLDIWIGDETDVCQWKANTRDSIFLNETTYRAFRTGCSDGVLRRVTCSRLDTIETFRVEYTPSTVQRLTLVRCNQRFKISTRAFPREVEQINFDHNHISGRPDLQTLPARLRILRLSWNLLRGPVALLDLPETLEMVFLECNMGVKQEVLLFDNLPKNFSIAQFNSGSVKCVETLEGEHVDPRWFVEG